MQVGWRRGAVEELGAEFTRAELQEIVGGLWHDAVVKFENDLSKWLSVGCDLEETKFVCHL